MSTADTIDKSRLADMRRVDAQRASQRTAARDGVEETFARRIVTGE